MESENSSKKTLEGIRILLETLPTVTYGSNIMPYLSVGDYGTGHEAFNSLKTDFENLNLSKVSVELEKEIKKQKNELAYLTKQHTSLAEIFGADGSASAGTLTHKLIDQLNKEVSDLIKKRDDLLNEVIKAESDTQDKISDFKTKVSDAESESQLDQLRIIGKIKAAENEALLKVQEVQIKAAGKVRIIQQFSDFLAETNSNMRLYHYVILLLVIGVGTTIALSVPDLLASFTSYNTFITKLGAKATSWQILNFAFGILIVKLPWALCLTAVFTGMYTLLKGLLTTYEKINQDKRNMSAIYAVSANIAESLNEYGLSIATHDHEDDENGELYIVLRAPNKQVLQKRESLKWNQIMNYFEGMQQQKAEVIITEEESSSLKFASEIANKLLEKIPSASQ